MGAVPAAEEKEGLSNKTVQRDEEGNIDDLEEGRLQSHSSITLNQYCYHDHFLLYSLITVATTTENAHADPY